MGTPSDRTECAHEVRIDRLEVLRRIHKLMKAVLGFALLFAATALPAVGQDATTRSLRHGYECNRTSPLDPVAGRSPDG
jgi:hypothetical protein